MRLKRLDLVVLNPPDKQVSLTDPDARSMHSRGKGVVGYNVQAAVTVDHHLIVAHEVTTQNTDRSQLFSMASQAREAMGLENLDAIADRGYYKLPEIKACEDAGIRTYIPKTYTSGNQAKGL
jgi:transposase